MGSLVKLTHGKAFYDRQSGFYIAGEQVMELPDTLTPALQEALNGGAFIVIGDGGVETPPITPILNPEWIHLKADLLLNNLDTVDDLNVLKAYKEYEENNQKRKRVFDYLRKRGA